MYGFRVALPGKSGTSTDPRDYSFSSEFTTVKVYSEHMGTLGMAANGTSFGTIVHNLGYVPMVIPYLELKSNRWFCGVGVISSTDLSIYGTNTDAYMSNQLSSVGTDNFVICLKNQTAGSINVRYKCYIMGDSGT